ncbi:hypothetical protein [Fibrella arboris]|uniref:hypothetical protein n=1 Tax=Fibrella arboris TaxID=3242486 RepID=UPI003522865B
MFDFSTEVVPLTGRWRRNGVVGATEVVPLTGRGWWNDWDGATEVVPLTGRGWGTIGTVLPRWCP